MFLRASWLLPISEPPIRDGWVAVESGRVVDVGRGTAGSNVRDLGRVAIMPGLVNAHTHLELSYLRGMIAPAADFISWVRQVLAARSAREPRSAEVMAGVGRGIEDAKAAGTAVVGDISNTLVTVEPLAASGLAGTVFHELIGFNVDDPARVVDEAIRTIDRLPAGGDVRPSLAAHAPYSVAPRLFHAIREAMDRRPDLAYSVHLAESPEESEFVRTGGGPWRSLLEDLGVWRAGWVPPGTSPVQYLDDAGFLGPRALAVHGVQMSDDDLGRLARQGATLVTCPRSNQFTGVGVPPIERFYASGVRVAVGTDSLASAPDLNVFGELAAMRAIAPSVPAATILESATRQGARALAADGDFGTIEPGRRARLIAVDVPPGVTDVEEYLLSGITPAQIHWVDSIDA